MRMRKKHHLEDRIERCSEKYLLPTEIITLNMKEAAETVYSPLDFRAIFGNSNPVHLEVGCGKGAFIAEMALRHPNINFIAIEKMSNVIVDACERADKLQLPNVRFLNTPAECLECYIPRGTISAVYLNFPTPLPKAGHRAQRLTERKYLGIYRRLSLPSAEIILKTDDRNLFEFSIEEFTAAGYALKGVTLDLFHSEYINDNVTTEHERRFVALGQPIYRLVAYAFSFA